MRVTTKAHWYLSHLSRSVLDESQNRQENNVKILGPGGEGGRTDFCF